MGEKLNALTIYTRQPQLFFDFANQYSEETGLVTVLAPKKEQKKALMKKCLGDKKIILDFEHKGFYYGVGKNSECGYIPIYKRGKDQDKRMS